MPTKPNIETTTTEDIVESTTSGYVISVPEDPLTLPPKPKPIETTSETSLETSTGYVISKPENPLTLPPRSEGTPCLTQTYFLAMIITIISYHLYALVLIVVCFRFVGCIAAMYIT